jgi:carboxymethylenebutenolidase
LTWACTDNRLAAIAPFYGAAPRPREAIRRMCPVVGSWPDKDFTTKAAGALETELTAAGIPHDLKVYPGGKHAFFNDQWRAYHPRRSGRLLAAGAGLFHRARPARPAVTGLRCGPGRGVLQVSLQAGPDSALHAAT